MNTDHRPNSQQKANSLSSRSLSSNTVDEQDLQAQVDKIKSLLHNPGVKLPDGGKKLRARLEELEQSLKPETSTITQGVSNLSLAERKQKPNMRQQIIQQSNHISNESSQSSSLLKANYPTATASTAMTENENTASSGRKTRMLGLDESVKLQESHEKDKKLAAMRKKMELVRESTHSKKRAANDSLADELSLTMSGLQLDPETRPLRPDDDDPDTEDEDDDDDDEEFYSNDDDEPLRDLERYDDEGFDEADDVINRYEESNSRRFE